ncbi:MAG: hypothetical protein D6734_02935 [Candidatus Schekmanbacteria bacterium]|nr:MAG: hypothetical protein D6734_02935 [Candidatus Schekmanbacteria bacterium]
MYFEIIERIENIETIAVSKSIRQLKRLERIYGKGRWRKLKGTAKIKLKSGQIYIAEIHWYEAHGIGKKEFKIKKILKEL